MPSGKAQMIRRAQVKKLRRLPAKIGRVIIGPALRAVVGSERPEADIQFNPRVRETVCLELGSGRSPYTTALKSYLGHGGLLIAFDTAESRLDSLAARLLNTPGAEMKYLSGTANNLALPDNSVDVVFFGYSIEGIGEPRLVLREAHRVLRPGGVLVLFLWRPTMTHSRRQPVLHHLSRHMMKDHELHDTYTIRLRYRRAPSAEDDLQS